MPVYPGALPITAVKRLLRKLPHPMAHERLSDELSCLIDNRVGGPGWRRNVALLAGLSVPFCAAASAVMMGLGGVIRYVLGAPAWFSLGLRFWLGAFPSARRASRRRLK